MRTKKKIEQWLEEKAFEVYERKEIGIRSNASRDQKTKSLKEELEKFIRALPIKEGIELVDNGEVKLFTGNKAFYSYMVTGKTSIMWDDVKHTYRRQNYNLIHNLLLTISKINKKTNE